VITHLLADIPTAGMNHKPNLPVTAPLDFNEVIATAQGTKLEPCPLILGIGNRRCFPAETEALRACSDA